MNYGANRLSADLMIIRHVPDLIGLISLESFRVSSQAGIAPTRRMNRSCGVTSQGTIPGR